MRKETKRGPTQCSVLILLHETNSLAPTQHRKTHTPLSQEHLPLPQGAIRPKHSPLPNPVVIHQERFQPPQQGESVQFADLIVREINGIKLVQSGTQVLNNRDFIAWRESARQGLDGAHSRADQSKTECGGKSGWAEDADKSQTKHLGIASPPQHSQTNSLPQTQQGSWLFHSFFPTFMSLPVFSEPNSPFWHIPPHPHSTFLPHFPQSPLIGGWDQMIFRLLSDLNHSITL